MARKSLISESSTLYGPYTGKGPKNYKRSDQTIVEECNQALERHGEVDASEIRVDERDLADRAAVPGDHVDHPGGQAGGL